MKALLIACMLFCITSVSLATEQATVVYDSAVLTEDVLWRGSILVKGFVVVAPQATLRIDPGTVIRFTSSGNRQLPNLVVLGRLQASGTSALPIVMTAERSGPGQAGWGGIVLLSTEKRNYMEQCRIEYAEAGINARYSNATLKDVSIIHAGTGLLLHDSVVQMSGGTVSDSETGVEVFNSEFEGKDTIISSCQRGFVANKSAVALTGFKITNSQSVGFDAEESRLKISGSVVSANALGAKIKGGEGQVVMSGFLHNKQTALHILGSRIKVQRCLFAENGQDALRMEDGRALLLNNAFRENDGFNLYNAGHETVEARQNWWGDTDSSRIGKKIYDAVQDKNAGVVRIFPWLNEKPLMVP